MRLEPKSLQQFASQTIYNQQSDLPWKILPPKLIARLGICKPDVSEDEVSESEYESAEDEVSESEYESADEEVSESEYESADGEVPERE